MHLRAFDAVVLDVILPGVDAVADHGEQFAAYGLRAISR